MPLCNKLVADIAPDGAARTFHCVLEAGHEGDHSAESRWDRLSRGEEPGGLNHPEAD